ncbi:unnamed protein product [Heligmosomoides polygyrus]|uniref:Uncharacterized protein n=1 Tax=Heligmosomoides polygyrus TaxID=6339 RepID=A0A183G7F3_HELPZ|nr:unnamed protein product [Heligmosomoides polygyrus]
MEYGLQPLNIWMKFFRYFTTNRLQNDLPPLTRLSSQTFQTMSSIQVPPATYNRMAFIATEWTTPLAMDASLIPLLLRLHPNDICSPSPSVPARPCVSARPSSRAAQQDSAERIFSPRVDIIAQYADRGRHLLDKTTADNEKRIKALLKKLKRSAKTQKELEHDVNEEKSFLDSLNDEWKPARLERVPQKPDTYLSLKSATDAVGRDLQRLSTKLRKVKTSSVTDSQQTEEFAEAEDIESGADEGDQFEGESLDSLPLNYEDTVAGGDALPEISRLDLSLLSPAVDVQTRHFIDFTTPKKNSPPRTLALPEWMRLLPLGETNSSRLPLLQYSPPVAPKAKTERCSQTQGFRSEIVDSACQTTDEERNPSDSGFLDTVEKSPRKKIEIVHPMSKQNIQEMLSQM